MAAKSPMSRSQTLTWVTAVLSVPASARKPSILARMLAVCASMLPAGSSLTCPASATMVPLKGYSTTWLMRALEWRRTIIANSCGGAFRSRHRLSRPSLFCLSAWVPASQDSRATLRVIGQSWFRIAAHASRNALFVTYGLRDPGGVDAVVPIKIAHRAGLAKMLHAERYRAVSGDAADPAQRCRMPIDGGNEPAVARYLRQQPFDVAHRAAVAEQSGLAGRVPAGIEPVRRRDRQHRDIAPIATDPARRLDGF